jgi:hypothetical protein
VFWSLQKSSRVDLGDVNASTSVSRACIVRFSFDPDCRAPQAIKRDLG